MLGFPDESSELSSFAGLPDELAPSMAAFLEEVYYEADPLSEAELEELAAAEDERRQAVAIMAALASPPRLAVDIVAEVFPGVRRLVVEGVLYAA